jgi:hypothetical protein
MNTNRVWAVALVVTLGLTIAVNYLVGATSAVGPTNGEISARYPTLLTPAGFAFSIWGVIYLGLISFAVYQVLPAQQDNPRFRRIRPYVVFNLLFNCAWIFLFTLELMWLSVVAMAGILVTLVLIHQGLEIGRVRVPPAEIWAARIPFSIYFGWVTAAAIINVTIALLAAGYDGGDLGSERWALLLLATALTIGVFLHARFRNRWFLLTLAWAFFGIAQNQAEVPLVMGGAYLAAFAALLTLVSRWVPTLGGEAPAFEEALTPRESSSRERAVTPETSEGSG